METIGKQFRKRNAILACLQGSAKHPSAESVFAQLTAEYPDISRGTVYRNLTYFKEQGLIASIGTVRGVERFDWNTSPHAHFICTRCGMVADLPGVQPGSDLWDKAASFPGKLEACHVTFSGICHDCLSAEHNKGGETE